MLKMENSDSVAEDGLMEAKGTAASKAIRRNFPKLSKAVTRGDILEELYAQELIDQQTFEIYTNPSLTDRDKGRKILLEVQSTVEIQPDHFDTFCSILDDESDVTKDLSKRLRGTYIYIYTYIDFYVREFIVDRVGVDIRLSHAHANDNGSMLLLGVGVVLHMGGAAWEGAVS